jgi:hypothetical protein
MVYQGVMSPEQITNDIVNARYDVKRAIKASQSEIAQLISDLGDDTKTTVTIDGQIIDKSNTVALSLAVNNKMDQLSTQTTTIISVFQQMFALEKTLGGSSSS